MTKRQEAKEAKRLKSYRDEMDAYFEHRYRHIGDWPHKPLPKEIRSGDAIVRNPEWTDAPFASKFIWDAPEPHSRKDKDSQG